mgnify:CR=1 FL=1
MVIIMNECLGCGEDIKTESWCELCLILVPEITKSNLNSVPDRKNAESLRKLLNDPSPNIRDVWKSLTHLDSKYSNWAHKQRFGRIQKRIFDWNEVENQYPAVFLATDDEMLNDNLRIYDRRKIEDIRRLQKGGGLPDGSHISWSSGNFFLDGEVTNLPYRDLREILDDYDGEDFDWKLLLYTISLSTQNKTPELRARSLHHARHLARNKKGKNMVKHPIDSLEPNLRNNRMYQFCKDACYGRYNQDMWIRHWTFPMSPVVFERTKSLVPISLSVNKGRLMLRVRRNDTWRRIRVPRDPKIWAILVNWCLSVPGTSNRNMLEGLQYYLFCDTNLKLISDADINGINFLRGIMGDSNGRVKLEKKRKLLTIEGDSGVNYRVKPGNGPHSSRFRVSVEVLPSDDKIEAQINRWMYDRRRFEEAGGIVYKDLCIVEEPHLRKLVIGDAIGSIVMALLNDQKSRKNIDTLDMHLSRFEKGNLNGIEERQRRAMANENIREQIDVLTRRLAQMQNNIVDEIDARLQVEMQEELANNIERIRVLQLNFDDRPPV